MSPFKEEQKSVGSCSNLFSKRYPLRPLLTSMTIQMISSIISPILPLYVRALGQRDNLIFARDDCFSYGSLSMLSQVGWENSETNRESP